jgi:hypothetical protein
MLPELQFNLVNLAVTARAYLEPASRRFTGLGLAALPRGPGAADWDSGLTAIGRVRHGIVLAVAFSSLLVSPVVDEIPAP